MNASLEISLMKSRKENKIPIFSCVVKEKTFWFFKTKFILLLTDRTIDLYNSEKGSLEKSFSLVSLRKLVFTSNSIKLEFIGGNLEFESGEQTKQIIGALIHVLPKILNQKELDRLDFNRFSTKKSTNVGFGPLISLQERAKVARKEICQEYISQFKEILETMDPYLDLCEVDPEIFSLTLEVLPLCYNIKEINIVSHSYDAYKILLDHIDKLENILRINIDGIIGGSGRTFFEAAQKSLKFKGFGFANSKFNIDDLELLSQFIENQGIISLSLHDAVGQEAMPYFMTNFFYSSISNYLLSLNLSGTENLDLKKLFPSIRFLYQLSLANCQQQVSTILELVSKNKMGYLRTLDISGNSCNILRKENCILHRNLNHLIADNIKWENNSMIEIFRIISNRGKYKMKLSIKNAQQSDHEWDNFFDFLLTIRLPGLTELFWDHNTIRPHLFNFLQFSNLVSLSLSYCFSGDINEYILQFLQNSPIKNLIIRGSQDKNVNMNFPNVVRSLLDSNIITIDISGNPIGDSGVKYLSFFDKSNVQRIIFDKSGVSNSDILLHVLSLSRKFAAPYHDLNNFPETKNSIVKLINKPPNESNNEEYPTPLDSPFLECFGIPREKNNDPFQLYLDANEKSSLRFRKDNIEMPEISSTYLTPHLSINDINKQDDKNSNCSGKPNFITKVGNTFTENESRAMIHFKETSPTSTKLSNYRARSMIPDVNNNHSGDYNSISQDMSTPIDEMADTIGEFPNFTAKSPAGNSVAPDNSGEENHGDLIPYNKSDNNSPKESHDECVISIEGKENVKNGDHEEVSLKDRESTLIFNDSHSTIINPNSHTTHRRRKHKKNDSQNKSVVETSSNLQNFPINHSGSRQNNNEQFAINNSSHKKRRHYNHGTPPVFDKQEDYSPKPQEFTKSKRRRRKVTSTFVEENHSLALDNRRKRNNNGHERDHSSVKVKTSSKNHPQNNCDAESYSGGDFFDDIRQLLNTPIAPEQLTLSDVEVPYIP